MCEKERDKMEREGLKRKIEVWKNVGERKWTIEKTKKKNRGVRVCKKNKEVKDGESDKER